eukprot:8040441-Alexandrium_andersonii.AAC.1
MKGRERPRFPTLERDGGALQGLRPVKRSALHLFLYCGLLRQLTPAVAKLHDAGVHEGSRRRGRA